jgi:phosphoserine phosphatase RsbU/P
MAVLTEQGRPGRILVAEDDPIARRLLEVTLRNWDYDVQSVEDGISAWKALSANDPPCVAILDWMMPGMDGVDVCRGIRAQSRLQPPYLLLCTSRDRKSDLVEGLSAGADDYITKPVDRDELKARLLVALRFVDLQGRLADRVRELEDALSKLRQLQSLLPMCSYCKKIRDDRNYWRRVEAYIMEHLDVRVSHGICPECYEKVMAEELRGRTDAP